MNYFSFEKTLSNQALMNLVVGQLNHLIPDGNPLAPEDISDFLDPTIQRLQHCFGCIHRKYYNENGRVVFNHLHSDHYAAFLYLLANTLHHLGADTAIASKLFLLNKALHGLDVFYAVELPEVFLFIHPVGTVLGNARYGNYFTVYQNCGIGALTELGDYPELGTGVVLYARSCVLGACHVGNDVVLGANSFLVGTDVPDHSVVVGQYPNQRILENREPVRNRIFHG